PGEIRTPGVAEQHLHPTLPPAPQQDAGAGAAGLVDLRLSDARHLSFAGAEDARSGPGLGASLDDRPDREQGDDGDDLGPEDDLVEIDGGPPHHLVAPDEERPDRAGDKAEPPSRALALALGALPASSTGATLDPGGGDHGHAVLLVGVAEHALDGERVPRLRDDVVDLHHGLLPASCV